MKREVLIISAFVLTVLTSNGVQGFQKGPGEVNWSYCSPNTMDYYKINYARTKPPFPAIINKHFYYAMSLNISKDIIWPTLRAHVMYELHFTDSKSINVTFVDVKLNFCDFWVDNVGTHCPIKPGTYEMTGNVTIPETFRPGKYYSTFDMTDEEGKAKSCINIDFVVDTE